MSKKAKRLMTAYVYDVDQRIETNKAVVRQSTSLQISHQPLEMLIFGQDAMGGIPQLVHLFGFQSEGSGKALESGPFGFIVQRLESDLHIVEFDIAAGTRSGGDLLRAAAALPNLVRPAGEAFPQERHRLGVVAGNADGGIGTEHGPEGGDLFPAIPFVVDRGLGIHHHEDDLVHTFQVAIFQAGPKIACHDDPFQDRSEA